MSSHDPVLHEQVSRIYQEQHRWLRSWLRPRVDCQHLAADLVQDVFVRILGTQDASSKLRSVREPRGYLATIARRMMIDHFRRQRLERAWLKALAERPEAEDISPETRLMLLDTLCELDAMLGALGENVRKAFLLSQLDGMTYKAIAQTLGISLMSVNRYIAKAVQHCMVYSLQHEL